MLHPDGKLTPARFKKRMMDLGFRLADLADEDMVVLDLDNSGFIEGYAIGISNELSVHNS
jgi:hypothetical protein